MRYFNVSGPCFVREHYMIDAASRLHGVRRLIDTNQYFVIHAARQSGKTTYLRELTDRLNAEGRYYALYCSLENLQGFTDPVSAIPLIVKKIGNDLRDAQAPGYEVFARNADYSNVTDVLRMELSQYCRQLDKPLVVLFDESDCLSEGTLISFLRQLRSGYNSRGAIPFVHSLALVGMRNIRDYKAHVRPESESLGSASPFNIVTKAMTLENFTRDEVVELYRQHTDASGQEFAPEAIDAIYAATLGQPWLVNAVAREVIVEMLGDDYSRPVTAELVKQAIQTIILRRDVHIDSLLERLKEERVRRVIEAMILGDFIDTYTDDFYYVRDLGLIREIDDTVKPANPIYAEVMIRTLSSSTQTYLTQAKVLHASRYIKDGAIDIDLLLGDFQQFWRENSAIWVKQYQYEEAAPHLVLMAFLQRVVNGGGQIVREMAAGRDRVDTCVIYGQRKYPIEIKLWRGEKSLSKGLEQTARYMDICGCERGWLFIFDRRPGRSWEDKIYRRDETASGKTITILGA